MNCGNSKMNDEEKQILSEVKKEIKDLKKELSKEKAEELFKKGIKQQENKNYEIAKMYFESTAEVIPMSNYYLANYYGSIKRDKKKYVEWLEKSSDKGIPEASKELGNYFYEKEPSKSVDYYIKMYKQGNKEDVRSILMAYSRSKDINKVEKDKNIKIEKFLKEESIKNLKIKEELASFYQIEEREKEEEEIYINLINENYFDGEKLLGKFYFGEKKYSESEKWLLKALKKNYNDKEKKQIKWMLEKIKKMGIKKNKENAKKELEKLRKSDKNE